MLGIAEVALTIPAALLTTILAFLLVEIVAAMTAPPRQGRPPGSHARPTLAVLVPAHDEEAGIRVTLDALRRQLRASDRLLVIADNCTDDTARIAREAGAEAIERHDPGRRGKGFALQFGIDHLRLRPPEVVAVIDADCLPEPDSLDILAVEASTLQRPIQAHYRMTLPADADLQSKISAFAFHLKNFVRPSGLSVLGLPCPLFGTGMAFPWAILRGTPLATGHIVEDMKMGIALAIAGHPPLFEPRAIVTSRFPATEGGRMTQRRRWEHGHLGTIGCEAPRLLYEFARQRRMDLLAAAADTAVPPLSFLSLILAVLIGGAALLAALGGSGIALWICLIAAALAGAGLALAWHAFGRDLLGAGDLLAIPLYVARKIPMYLRVVHRRENRWIRAARDERASSKEPL